jgi:formylglycine-generating enzyme required for sulfatase activity
VESVLLDAEYLMALEHAPDAGARAYYQEQGKRIAEIQRDILAVSAQEALYDVFVCYKESTEGGSRTPDSVLAQEIHQHLTEKGMRVFYARISLEEHAGQKYEPYIYGALTSARVMVAVGTKAEHFNAVWVRNEWSRFLQLRRKDRGKVLIPCYKGMDAYELPQELAELQSQDMGRLGFMQDLVRGVEKVLGRDRAKPAEKASASTASSETAGWLERAWVFLEDGEFDSAKEYVERVLDREPKNGEAYWLKALAGLSVKRESDVIERQQSLFNDGNYQKAMRFGTVDLKRRLEGIEQEIRRRLAEAQRIKEEEQERRRMAEEARAVEMVKARKIEEESRLRLEAEERERHQSVLARVRELVANGYLKEASELYGGVKKRLSGLDYQGVELALNQALSQVTRLESGLKEAILALQAAAARGRGFVVFPPLARRHECRMVRGLASKAIGEAAQYLTTTRGSSGEALGELLETAKEFDRQVGYAGAKVDRLVKVLGSVWLAMIFTGGITFIAWQAEQERARQRIAAEVKAAEERALAEAKAAKERALAEAKAKAEAEERERQRVAAEAKAAEERALAEAEAKAKSGEPAMALRLGLIRLFEPGLSGRLGPIAVRWIPSGRFTMVSPSTEDVSDSGKVQHDVELSRGFFLAETECTQVQWATVMKTDPSSFKGSDRPVEKVSWNEAVEYCQKLTSEQRQEGILTAEWEWRLPTESEWEYAARAGAVASRTGEMDAIGWHGGNSGGETHAVKGKRANAWGLYDMVGNVWEWCWDWSGDYPSGVVTDPTGPNVGSSRVFRGGSWLTSERGLRWAERREESPGVQANFLGFRPALCYKQHYRPPARKKDLPNDQAE